MSKQPISNGEFDKKPVKTKKQKKYWKAVREDEDYVESLLTMKNYEIDKNDEIY